VKTRGEGKYGRERNAHCPRRRCRRRRQRCDHLRERERKS